MEKKDFGQDRQNSYPEGSASRVWRVQTNYYRTREEAEEAAKKLRKLGYPAFVV